MTRVISSRTKKIRPRFIPGVIENWIPQSQTLVSTAILSSEVRRSADPTNRSSDAIVGEPNAFPCKFVEKRSTKHRNYSSNRIMPPIVRIYHQHIKRLRFMAGFVLTLHRWCSCVGHLVQDKRSVPIIIWHSRPSLRHLSNFLLASRMSMAIPYMMLKTLKEMKGWLKLRSQSMPRMSELSPSWR